MHTTYDPTSLRPRAALRRALAGRRVLVTGAALDGVGRVLAHIHALHGAEVVLADVLPLEAVAAECAALGAARVVACRFDAAVEGDSARMVREACAGLTGGGLDAVYLNHNVGVFSPMLEQPELVRTARRLMAINFFAYAEIADAAMPFLLAAAAAAAAGAGAGAGAAPPSAIVAISSLAAVVPMLDTHAYAASKAAIASWFSALRIELRRDAARARLLSVHIMNFSAVRTATLVRALGGEGGPNKHVLALAADPVDAAFATIEACRLRRPVSYFPASVGILPTIYAIWPWLARRIVSSVVVKAVAVSTSNPAGAAAVATPTTAAAAALPAAAPAATEGAAAGAQDTAKAR